MHIHFTGDLGEVVSDDARKTRNARSRYLLRIIIIIIHKTCLSSACTVKRADARGVYDKTNITRGK